MPLERWVVPPAIAAAVFTLVAIVPPGGAPARGLRIESIGARTSGRALLVRIAEEDAGSTDWRAPSRATVRVAAAGTEPALAVVTPSPGVPYSFAQIFLRGDGPYQIDAMADGLSAHATLRPRAAIAIDGVAATDSAENAAGVRAIIEGGTLVPEVPGVLLLHLDDSAGTAVSVTPTDDSLRVTPARALVDACGIAVFSATVAGLDAHVNIVVSGIRSRSTRRRLPVIPGALALAARGHTLSATTAIGGQPVYFIAGDARGTSHWTAQRLPDAPNSNAHVELRLPDTITWAAASLSPAFEQTFGLWLTLPPTQVCNATALGERFARASVALPAIPPVDLVYDGAAIAAVQRSARQERARYLAVALAALAMAMLVGLVLTAGIARDPQPLRGVSIPARQRLFVALGGSLALLVGGWALLNAFILRM